MKRVDISIPLGPSSLLPHYTFLTVLFASCLVMPVHHFCLSNSKLLTQFPVQTQNMFQRIARIPINEAQA